VADTWESGRAQRSSHRAQIPHSLAPVAKILAQQQSPDGRVRIAPDVAAATVDRRALNDLTYAGGAIGVGHSTRCAAECARGAAKVGATIATEPTVEQANMTAQVFATRLNILLSPCGDAGIRSSSVQVHCRSCSEGKMRNADTLWYR
jgi:hypothetical protein